METTGSVQRRLPSCSVSLLSSTRCPNGQCVSHLSLCRLRPYSCDDGFVSAALPCRQADPLLEQRVCDDHRGLHDSLSLSVFPPLPLHHRRVRGGWAACHRIRVESERLSGLCVQQFDDHLSQRLLRGISGRLSHGECVSLLRSDSMPNRRMWRAESVHRAFHLPVRSPSLPHLKGFHLLLHVHPVSLFRPELRLAPFLLPNGQGVSRRLLALSGWNLCRDHMHHQGVSRVASCPLPGWQLHDVAGRV